jgi:hypothetical protein
MVWTLSFVYFSLFMSLFCCLRNSFSVTRCFCRNCIFRTDKAVNSVSSGDRSRLVPLCLKVTADERRCYALEISPLWLYSGCYFCHIFQLLQFMTLFRSAVRRCGELMRALLYFSEMYTGRIKQKLGKFCGGSEMQCRFMIWCCEWSQVLQRVFFLPTKYDSFV